MINAMGAHPDREEGSVFLSSFQVFQRKLRLLEKKGIAHKQS